MVVDFQGMFICFFVSLNYLDKQQIPVSCLGHVSVNQDFLAENSLSVSDSAVDMASRTCPEDRLLVGQMSLVVKVGDGKY